MLQIKTEFVKVLYNEFMRSEFENEKKYNNWLKNIIFF